MEEIEFLPAINLSRIKSYGGWISLTYCCITPWIAASLCSSISLKSWNIFFSIYFNNKNIHRYLNQFYIKTQNCYNKRRRHQQNKYVRKHEKKEGKIYPQKSGERGGAAYHILIAKRYFSLITLLLQIIKDCSSASSREQLADVVSIRFRKSDTCALMESSLRIPLADRLPSVILLLLESFCSYSDN